MDKINDGYIDEYGRTEQEIYAELERKLVIPKNFDQYREDDNTLYFEFHFLEDDANELLANIGVNQKCDVTNYPKDQLKRIFRYYHSKSEKIVDGKNKIVDPLPEYKAGNGSYEEELFKFGYLIGKGGTIGIYYRLLPIFQFRRGYWVGKMERSVELNDDEILRELCREMKIYDAKEANDEMGYIVNNIFKEEPEEKGMLK